MSGGKLATESQLAAEAFVWALQGICQLHRIPIAPALLPQQFPPPYSVLSFQQAAQVRGLKSGARAASAADLSRLPRPFVAVLSPDSSAEVSQPEAPARLAIVVKCDEGRITYFENGTAKPVNASLAAFAEIFAGMVVLCSPAAPSLKNEDAAA